MKAVMKAPSRETLAAMSYNAMDKDGSLEYCKASFPDLFEAKYVERFGYKPGQRPASGVNVDKRPVPKADAAMLTKLEVMTWDEMDRANLLRVAKNFPKIYNAAYKKKFGKLPA